MYGTFSACGYNSHAPEACTSLDATRLLFSYTNMVYGGDECQISSMVITQNSFMGVSPFKTPPSNPYRSDGQ